MAQTRSIINEGLSARAEAKLKVRQPLASVTVPQVGEEFAGIIAEELNVQQVKFHNDQDVILDTELTPELKAEGAMRDLVRHIQNLRKNSGLNVDDRIVLNVQAADELINRALTTFADAIKQETLAKEIASEKQEFEATVKIEGAEAVISIKKV